MRHKCYGIRIFSIAVLAALALFAGSGTVRSQAIIDAKMYEITNFNLAPHINIDGANNIWASTYYSLHMYDHEEWTSFRPGIDFPSQLMDFHVDDSGQAWIATDEGIGRWDGTRWIMLNAENSGMPHEQVYQVCVTGDGILWACGYDDLMRYDGAEWTSFELSKGGGPGMEEMILTDDYQVWLLANTDQLYRSNAWTDSTVTMDYLGDYDIMQESPDGDIWIGLGKDMYGEDLKTVVASNPLDYTTHMVLSDSDGYWWFLSDKMVCKKGDLATEVLLSGENVSNGLFQAMAIDHDGQIWAIDTNGVVCFDPRFIVLLSPQPNRFEWFNEKLIPQWFPDNNITLEWFSKDIGNATFSYSINDNEGEIVDEGISSDAFRYGWHIPANIIPVGDFTAELHLAVSSRDGIADTTTVTVERYGYSEGYTLELGGIQHVHDACQGADDSIWIIANSKLYHNLGDMWAIYDMPTDEIVGTPDGYIWLLSDTGITQCSGTNWTHWFNEGFDHHMAVVNNELWVSFREFLLGDDGWYRHYQRLYRYHDGEWIDENKSLEEDFIIEFISGGSGNDVWLQGRIWVEGETMQVDEYRVWDAENGGWHGFSCDIASWELISDKQGNMWGLLGNYSPGKMLHKFVDGEWIPYPVDPGLMPPYDKNIFLDFVTVDDDNRFWFNSDCGILIFDGESWSRFFSLPWGREYILVLVESNNIIWLQNQRGVQRFDRSQVPVDTTEPTSFAVNAPFPNPFNPVVTIPFTLPETMQVELSIYSISGQRVRTLHRNDMPPGTHTIQWDGRNNSGIPVSSGTYICRVRAGAFSAVRRITLIR